MVARRPPGFEPPSARLRRLAAARAAARATQAQADAAWLQAAWLASPALPVGGFSYSEGLESAVECGLVADAGTARIWLADQLMLSLARGDLAVVAQALLAWQTDNRVRARELNDWVAMTRETAESRQQVAQMGRSLLEWLRNRVLNPGAQAQVDALAAWPPAPTWPVAFALAATVCGIARRQALLSFAFGWAENMTQAAIKAVPLGQSAAQRILQALAESLPAAIDIAQDLPDAARQVFTPRLAVLSAQHETQYSRLFRS